MLDIKVVLVCAEKSGSECFDRMFSVTISMSPDQTEHIELGAVDKPGVLSLFLRKQTKTTSFSDPVSRRSAGNVRKCQVLQLC